MKPDTATEARNAACRPAWATRLVTGCTALALLAVASCAPSAPPAATLDTGRMAAIVIGRSSRADVFAALGRPAQTRQSGPVESWVYETKAEDAGDGGFKNGALAAAGVAGAFVPYVGLIGPSLGLASAATGSARPAPEAASLTVGFGEDGIVRDCTYASTALPAGMPGSAAGSARITGCQRPPQSSAPAL